MIYNAGLCELTKPRMAVTTRSFLLQAPGMSQLSMRPHCFFPTQLNRETLIVSAAEGNVRRANLIAKRKLTVPFPDPSGLDKFLSQPAGMQTLINTNALQHYEQLDDTTYRCYLPKLEILNFQVSPIVDLSIDVNDTECMVKLLSCKFEGSELVEKQNKRFSACMKNHLTWDPSAEQLLNVDVEVNVSLEVYTLPFTLLPLSAVEAPGSIVLQAMVDRLVPIFLDHLFDDYRKWSRDKSSEIPQQIALNSGAQQAL